MKYDFSKEIIRRGTNCYKYDEMPNDDTIALWVADMDFETAPCIVEALKKRMEHGCFGYSMVPDTYYEANIDWFARRHAWHGIKKEWFIYTSGVVPAVSAILKAMTMPGFKVAMHTPAYNCFYSCLRNNGCQLREIALGEDIEEACSDPMVKVLLLCNPQNPTGHVWTREELERMAEVCHKHNVFVISDEIHCEFVNPKLSSMRNGSLPTGEGGGRGFIPYATVAKNNNFAVCVSPSKAFNIAGLQIANIICPDEEIRQRIDRAININEVCDVNPFGVIALQAAYSKEGEEWFDQLNEYIYGNYEYVKEFIETNIPQWKITPLEGTYLMWVKVNEDADALCERLLKEANVYINSGSMYGDNAYIRINLATQRTRLKEAFDRICHLTT